MTETFEEKQDRLQQEKIVVIKALENPGTQLVFAKLRDMAKASIYDYDNCDFSTSRGREMAQRIQARRYVILKEIPRMLDEIVNVDLPRIDGKKAWSFTAWIESMRDNIKRFFRFL